MTSELRWILLIIGLMFIAVLAWWERRRPRQASATSAAERASPREFTGERPARPLREPAFALPTMHAREPHELPAIDLLHDAPAVPVLEPAATPEARAADPLEEAALMAPPTAPRELHEPPPAEREFAYVPKIEPVAVAPPTLTTVPPTAVPAMTREVLPELPAAATPLVEWPPDQQRRIVALRLIAPSAERFAGRSLRQALCAEGFVLGKFAIFHKPDEERRAVLSAASLTRPGTFDADTMDSQHYGGLSLFAVLPGPKAPPQAFDELVFTARSLNERLHGVLQDEKGSPLTPSRIALLRERLSSGATL